jgi:hypothetical protein
MFRPALLCCGLFAASLDAAAFDIACPGKIVTSQKLMERAPGWKEFVRPDGGAKPRRWSRVSRIDLYDGDPKEIAQLKPDDEDAKEDSWSFNAPSPPERPLYMACVYFDTRIQFIKALPLNVRKCTSSREGILRCEEFKR